MASGCVACLRAPKDVPLTDKNCPHLVRPWLVTVSRRAMSARDHQLHVYFLEMALGRCAQKQSLGGLHAAHRKASVAICARFSARLRKRVPPAQETRLTVDSESSLTQTSIARWHRGASRTCALTKMFR